MNETIDNARAAAQLGEAISSTFADMAFMDVTPVPPTPGTGLAVAAEDLVRLAIDILRPISCRLELECSASLKERIQSTLFQGESAVEGREDSLLEMLNVAAGVFLSSRFGPGADTKLELPEYLFLSEGSEGEVLAEAWADAEGEPIRAVLRSIRYRY